MTLNLRHKNAIPLQSNISGMMRQVERSGNGWLFHFFLSNLKPINIVQIGSINTPINEPR